MLPNHHADIADKLHTQYLKRCWPDPAEAPPVRWAAALDHQADAELQHGHHAAAGRLSRQAAELREVSR